MNWKSIAVVGACAVALALSPGRALARSAGSAFALAQDQSAQAPALSAIPLEIGNYWIYDFLSVHDFDSTDVIRTEAATKMAVEELVHVLPVEENTLYSNREDAFGVEGAPYYILTIDSHLGFFPGMSVRTRPDGFLVQDHGDGNIWAKGFLRGGEVYVAAEEQPWFLIAGPETYTFDLSGDVFTYFQERRCCLGDGLSARFVQLARASLPDLAPSEESRAVQLRGESRCVHCGVSITFVTGLGPIRSLAGFFEFRHFRYELSRAFVSGIWYDSDRTTNSLPPTWGNVKAVRQR